jgi:hypothetical protein
MSGSGVTQRGDGLIRTLLFISQFCREARMSWLLMLRCWKRGYGARADLSSERQASALGPGPWRRIFPERSGVLPARPED